MLVLKKILRNIMLLNYVIFSVSCTAAEKTEMVLIGSTPGDVLIKSMLKIPSETKVDFIKWNLRLEDDNSFALNIVYGESQPNTLGLKQGGEKRSLQGTFAISKNTNSNLKEIYRLKSDGLAGEISFVKLSENVFHLLTPNKELMTGNGGWSYSLSRKEPVSTNKILITSTATDEKSLQLVYDGRTPCQEIAGEHPEMNTSSSCFKLKWRLILNRDSINLKPSTCIIRKVIDNQPRDVTGTWTIINGIQSNPGLVVYKVIFDKAEESISFLVADDNVLFFLNKQNEPYIGNENFSYTMNKRNQQGSTVK